MIASIETEAGGRVSRAIRSAASATGVDFAYLLQQARLESGLNPDARAGTSSAAGLYQFVEQSWLGIIKQHGSDHGLGWASAAIGRGGDGRYHADPALRATILDLRRDPQAAAAMAAELASDNRALLEAKLGRAVAPVDLYLAHFLGAGGATRFLRAMDRTPDSAAAPLFPAAARANRAIFYAPNGTARTLAEIRDRFAAKFNGVSRPTLPPLSIASRSADSGRLPVAAANRAELGGDASARVRLAYLMLASLGAGA